MRELCVFSSVKMSAWLTFSGHLRDFCNWACNPAAVNACLWVSVTAWQGKRSSESNSWLPNHLLFSPCLVSLPAALSPCLPASPSSLSGLSLCRPLFTSSCPQPALCVSFAFFQLVVRRRAGKREIRNPPLCFFFATLSAYLRCRSFLRRRNQKGSGTRIEFEKWLFINSEASLIDSSVMEIWGGAPDKFCLKKNKKLLGEWAARMDEQLN